MRLTALAVPSSLALSALALTGCAKTLSGDEAEKVIKASGTAYKSVDCPNDIDAKRGYTFTCDADTTQGKFKVTVKIESIEGDKANMRIVSAKKVG